MWDVLRTWTFCESNKAILGIKLCYENVWRLQRPNDSRPRCRNKYYSILFTHGSTTKCHSWVLVMFFPGPFHKVPNCCFVTEVVKVPNPSIKSGMYLIQQGACKNKSTQKHFYKWIFVFEHCLFSNCGENVAKFTLLEVSSLSSYNSWCSSIFGRQGFRCEWR